MTFARSTKDHTIIIALSFQDTYTYQEAISNENGAWMITPSIQTDLARFATDWLKNIHFQQFS